MPQVVAFAGPLTHASEHGIALSNSGDIPNKLLDNDVLPTPAPPRAPILPPRAKGQIRSTTLMPVSSTWAEVSCSSNAGAAR